MRRESTCDDDGEAEAASQEIQIRDYVKKILAEGTDEEKIQIISLILQPNG